ncbi:helix-hairpin-helix domain-containing protein [Flavobacterium sp. MAH-1]|uniref:Helix-hairpin-helix domain-containing protein n=1 Tax=Flavobacterium agri TaxID=2743471 RepID=A0A7Y9C617_9FLAO|nr:helix-hairpin-helix domain-containing protein [Flavobacterium agri]NUY81857.1 helix-hairpin-helix domain-containing protein [Flavobacterium agri]NYA71881.1 helix-hairpin-helix domain-containing protein [Flavobacterium agri]
MKTSLQNLLGYTRTQRVGIISLASLIVIFQIAFRVTDFLLKPKPIPQDREWLALQNEIDSLAKEKEDRKTKIYPFNPNFITDYKGYRLGMSVAEIDRLLAFRNKNLYVNSVEDFQKVTGVSDSLLVRIAPYFKFPDWVNRKHSNVKYDFRQTPKKEISKTDINKASKQELMAVFGIGNALSDRIILQRETLGGFVDMSQMRQVWGLSDEVIEKLNERFKVAEIPTLRKINVNEASLRELSAFPYFRYALAKSIVTYRSMNGRIVNSDDLLKIDNFPVDNVKIISLYLEF